MKKLWMILFLAVVLTGCSAAETFETVNDQYAEQTAMAPRLITFDLPEDAAAQVMRSESGTLYFCEGYEIMLQTLSSGDLNRTLQTLTGYSADALTVIETAAANVKCFESAWTAAAEEGDQVGRTVILDDGNYHYCLSVMASAREAGSLQECWQELFSSLALQA